jgi:hypothetical protein
MSKHDTWVQLISNSPFETILGLFVEGAIPVRDPFPIERIYKDNGEHIALFVTDGQRMTQSQINAFGKLYSETNKTTFQEVMVDYTLLNGFLIDHKWIDSMRCGPEGFTRSKELLDFLEINTESFSYEVYNTFYQEQYDRWINGEAEPSPINSIEDIDPRLRTPKLEQSLKFRNFVASKDYSVMDVLLGKSIVEFLNEVDPDNNYEVVALDEIL